MKEEGRRKGEEGSFFLLPFSLLLAAERLLIGGQAVIEGVMMRSPRWTATAVRRPGGAIVAYTERCESLLGRYRWLRLPVVRGVIALYEALVIGVRALMLSANTALAGEEFLTPQHAPNHSRSLSRTRAKRVVRGSGSGPQVGLTVLTGLTVGVGLFFMVPAALVRWLDPYFATAVAANLAEGVVRVAMLVGYVGAIGRVPEIRRVFAYHGAEHKAVAAYEAGARLEPAVVRTHSRFHLRCGTSLLLVVMLVAIVVFVWLGRPPLWQRLLSRVVLVPLMAGVSYELIRAGVRFRWCRPIVLPGLWLQRMTTREPDDAQLEVAIRALREVVEREREPA